MSRAVGGIMLFNGRFLNLIFFFELRHAVLKTGPCWRGVGDVKNFRDEIFFWLQVQGPWTKNCRDEKNMSLCRRGRVCCCRRRRPCGWLAWRVGWWGCWFILICGAFDYFDFFIELPGCFFLRQTYGGGCLLTLIPWCCWKCPRWWNWGALRWWRLAGWWMWRGGTPLRIGGDSVVLLEGAPCSCPSRYEPLPQAPPASRWWKTYQRRFHNS